MSLQMRRPKRARIGKVSIFWHHQCWWIYYREKGIPGRIRIGLDRREAERVAASVNAELSLNMPSCFSFEAISLPALAERWLAYQENVLRSSLATVARYRTALRHILNY